MKTLYIIPLFFMLLMFGANAHAQCADPLSDKCGRVTGIVDVDFGVDDFTGNEIHDESICVYTQADGDGRARVRNTGGSTQLTADTRRFAVTDGFGNEIQVRAQFSGSVDTTFRNIVASSGYQNKIRDVGEHPTEDETCSLGGDTNTLRTRINRAWIGAAIPGVYTGFIEMQMSPD
ncbi:MAG: hypothetical protein VX730_05655 [Pseudomonadota bacterium]|nr:hypothetical protein [Pseudomonadota bacterium]